MRSRLVFVSLLFVIGAPAITFAQDTVVTHFDFEAPAAGQSGAYSAEPGAEIAGGFGRVAARAGWSERAQSVRVAVAVDNAGADTPRAVVPVLTGDCGGMFRGAAALDGTDVTAYGADGTAFGRPVASGVSTPSGRGAWLVRMPTLVSGASSFFLYAGDRASAAAVDELAYFTDPTPAVRYFATGAFVATDASVVTMIASNDVVIGGAADTLVASLDGRNRTAAMLGSEVVAAGPIAAAWMGAGGDSLPPESFAGRSFVIPSPRFDEALYVVAPFGDATLTFTRPALAPVTVTGGTAMQIATLVLDADAIVVDADAPIVVVRGSVSGDITPMPPAATELLGVVSGTVRVAAGPAGASLTYHRSDGTMATATVPANGEVSLSPAGAQGSGPALRVLSDQPIGAITYGDGDGGEAVAFLPPALLGRELVMAVGAQFVAIATALPNTTCRLLAPDGTELASGTTGPFATPVPGYLFFGSATNGLRFAAPAQLRCSNAVWAEVEDSTSDIEKLMIAAPAHRPGLDVTVTPGAIEPRFDPGASAAVSPSFVASRPMVGIRRMDTTDVVGFGGTVSYQVSLDAGATWLVPSGGTLAAPSAGEGAPAADFAGVSFPEADEIAVRALLSTDGVADAAVDAVEIEAVLVPPPVRLAFETISSPQRAGTEFSVAVTARDASDALVRIDGTVSVTSDPPGVIAAFTTPMVDGTATLTAAPSAGASMVFVIAEIADLAGSSNPFEVVAGSATRTLEVVSGDMQGAAPGATLAEPVVVRLTDADGAPIEGDAIGFSVSTGGGTASPATATTDADGLAMASWTLGDAGANTLRVTLVDDPAVAVVVSATATEGGGCDCSAAPGLPAGPRGLGVLLLGLAWVIARRRWG
jgi:MYXO-CTERM domain-containing protein